MEATFQGRLEAVRARIAAACARAGRTPSEVSIVAVAKTFGPDAVQEAAESGLTVIGENRVQEAKQKIPLCPGHLEWHMIGHLQRNKVGDAVRLFRMIHAVDSWRLMEAIERCAEVEGVRMPVCVEVNVSGESSKFGLKLDEAPDVLRRGARLAHVDVVGLMTIPPVTEEAEGARPFFARLRELRDRWQNDLGVGLRTLSMGMSGDFEVAIEEGATWVRLGSVLFGARPHARPEADGTWTE